MCRVGVATQDTNLFRWKLLQPDESAEAATHEVMKERPIYPDTIWMPATAEANRSINLKSIQTQVRWVKAFILARNSFYSSTYRFEQM